jgi:hypothetical protein
MPLAHPRFPDDETSAPSQILAAAVGAADASGSQHRGSDPLACVAAQFVTLLILIGLLQFTGCAVTEHTGVEVQDTHVTADSYNHLLVLNQARLAGVDHATITEQSEGSIWLVPFTFVGNACDTLFFEPIGHGIQYLGGDTASNAARKMLDPNSPDNRRWGTFRMASWDFGRAEPYTRLYRYSAAHDSDYTVRAAGIRACNWSRDRLIIDTSLKAMEDDQFLVRLEAAKSLANLPDDSEVPTLLRHLQDDSDDDVRIACADALRNFHTGEVSRNLVQVLEDPSFGVAVQARLSLDLITARDFGFDAKAWLNYLSEQPG